MVRRRGQREPRQPPLSQLPCCLVASPDASVYYWTPGHDRFEMWALAGELAGNDSACSLHATTSKALATAAEEMRATRISRENKSDQAGRQTCRVKLSKLSAAAAMEVGADAVVVNLLAISMTSRLLGSKF